VEWDGGGSGDGDEDVNGPTIHTICMETSASVFAMSTIVSLPAFFALFPSLNTFPRAGKNATTPVSEHTA
jgi:hypothetical protein